MDDHRETAGRNAVLARRMDRLVEDLLARVEIGAIRLKKEPLDLQDVIDVASREARALAVANDLLLHAQVPDLPCRIEGDAERLTQAILIVIDNAVRRSDPNWRIDLALDCAGRDGLIRVKHVGRYLPPTCYRDLQPVAGGDLGLSVAKWILDQHGGRMKIASDGRETVVKLHLPLIT